MIMTNEKKILYEENTEKLNVMKSHLEYKLQELHKEV